MHCSFQSCSNPQLETWHRRLGHANFWTVLDMARNNLITGMQVNLNLVLQACDVCICGKQTHHLVPKSHERNRADRCLGHIFVDLSGPQTISACSGCSYIMNIINNYLGYHWTRLLKTKAEASSKLHEWLLVAETQSGEKLSYLVTDNGKLCLNEMA